METQISITEEKLKSSEVVEVIIETEAQTGVSGINVSGGGREGLFVSEILKDSPAAKALPLLEGDQLVSARFYFENMKYEDALKILQCAELCKVSYCLKRTVPSADVSVSPKSGSVEVKGPKAKMPKMTVKSLTPVKKKKKKVSGQVKDSEEVSVEAMTGSEISVGSMDIPPVDVEFSLPKFSKLLKTKGAADASVEEKSTEVSTKVSATEQKWPKMKFPRLRVKDAAAGGVSVQVPESKVSSTKASVDVEAKDKTPTKFGISVPKLKKPKADVTLSKAEVELTAPKVEIEAKEGKMFKAPQVELDVSLPTIQTEIPEITAKESIKMAVLEASAKIPDVEIKMPTSHVEVEVPEGKFSMPQISNVGICLPKLEKESDRAVQVEGSKTEIKLPSVEIAAPKLDVDLSLPKVECRVEAEPSDTGKTFQVKLPKFGISTKAPEVDLDVSIPHMKNDVDKKLPDEKFKMPSIKAPEIGVTLPKGKVEGDIPDGKKKAAMKLPSLEISAPKVDLDMNLPKGKFDSEISVDVAGVTTVIPDVSLKMPQISPPKFGMKVKDAYAETPKVKVGTQQVDIKTEKIETGGSVEIPDVTLQMPKISMPKFGAKGDIQSLQAEVKTGEIGGESPDFKLKGPQIKLPSFGLSLSKEKLDTPVPELDISLKESEIEKEGKIKLPSIKVPSLDISLPKVQDIQPGKLEVSIPEIKADLKAPEVEGPEGHDFKLKMPKVSLPKFDLSAKVEKPQVSPKKIEMHTKVKEEELSIKMEKATLPKVDISIPKIKPVELDIHSKKPDVDISVDRPKVGIKIPRVGADAIAFDGETGYSKLGLPSVKMPSLEIEAPKLDIDLNLPKVKSEITGPHIEDAESRLQMPKINLPKLSDVAKDMAVELDVPKITGDVSLPHISADIKGPKLEGVGVADKGGKISLPKVGITLGKSTEDYDMEITGIELKGKPDIKLPKVKLEKPDVEETETTIKLPSVQLPSVEISTPKIPDVSIDASIPKVALEMPSTEAVAADVSGDADVKWKAPKFSLRKFGISGHKSKKGGEVDMKAEHVEGEADIAVKGPKMKMPKFGISFPKTKYEVDVDISKPVGVKTSKKKAEVSVDQLDESTEGKSKLPSVKLPSVDISAPKVEVDIGIPKADVSPEMDKPSDISIDIPDVKLNLPKFSLPKFGSKGKGVDVDVELESPKVSAGAVSVSKSGELDGGSADVKGKGKELKMKMPAIKMPSFGISRKEADAAEAKLEVSPPDIKIKKSKVVVKETKIETEESEGKTSFIKMPTFKMSPPKVKAPEIDLTVKGSKEELNLPDVHVKVPSVALPSIGIKSDKAADVTLPKAEAKVSGGLEGRDVHLSEKMKLPSLEISAPEEVSALQISVPCVKPVVCPSLPKAEVDVSDADIKGYGGDLKIPKLPSVDVSAPSLELGISLPKANLDKCLTHEVDVTLEKSETKLKMPKVELPKFGETEREVDAKLDTEGSKHKISESELKLKGPKIKMPHFDISLPKVRPDEDDIPFIEGELKMHGSSLETSSTEGTFSLPSVELPKMSTPKIRAPELELNIGLSKDELKDEEFSKTHKAETSGPDVGLPDLKFKMPKMKLPKFGGSSSDVEEETTKLDKSSKMEEGGDFGGMGFNIKMPKVQVGSLKGHGIEDVSMRVEGDHKTTLKSDMKASEMEDSEYSRRFKIKMPSFGISKESTEPLQPKGEGADLKIKMPKISIPDVGFSGSEGETLVASLEGDRAKVDIGGDAKIKGPKSSSIEDLELDLGLKMPKIKMPSIGMPGRKADDDMDVSLEVDSEGKKSLFKMPDVEISTPKMKVHAEYDVDGATLEYSKERETEGILTRKSSKTKEESKEHGAAEEDSGKKYKIKLPKFAISLPKSVPGDVELSSPRIKSGVKEGEISLKASGSERDTDHHEGKKVKKALFSLGKTKDKNVGLLESDADATLEGEGPELKIKMPKIKMKPSFGISRGKKATEVNGELDGTVKGHTDADMSPDDTTKSSKIKFPRLGFSSSKVSSGDVNGTGTSGANGESEVLGQNGSQDGMVKIGKVRLPKVEFSPTYKAKESDSEMNLKLVKPEEPEAKDEGNASTFSAKFKSPKITFSGFKKKNKGEEHLVTSPAGTEVATENVGEGEAKTGRSKISLGFLSSKSKGEYTVDNSGIQMDTETESKEKSSKYKIPKVSLDPKSGTELDSTTETHGVVEKGSQESLKISMPKVGFTTHHEEHKTEEKEVAGGFLKITTTKHIKTETITEKTVSI
ncbi:periaxin [Rhinophrynus dorsalis]